MVKILCLHVQSLSLDYGRKCDYSFGPLELDSIETSTSHSPQISGAELLLLSGAKNLKCGIQGNALAY